MQADCAHRRARWQHTAPGQVTHLPAAGTGLLWRAYYRDGARAGRRDSCREKWLEFGCLFVFSLSRVFKYKSEFLEVDWSRSSSWSLILRKCLAINGIHSLWPQKSSLGNGSRSCPSLRPPLVPRPLCQALHLQAPLLGEEVLHLEEGTAEGKDSAEGGRGSTLLWSHASGPTICIL